LDVTWWKHGVIYQIYPRSFLDSKGDGVGDVCGIIDRLDYLAWLGVDAIWISPIYPSPMADFGYDIMDFRGNRSDIRHPRRRRPSPARGAWSWDEDHPRPRA
jgi:1,4-alpha-glucan branching enzyme